MTETLCLDFRRKHRISELMMNKDFSEIVHVHGVGAVGVGCTDD